MQGLGLRGLLAIAAGAASLAFVSTASADDFVVLYKQQAVPASAATDIQNAGGKLVYGYDQIGVAIASSDSSSFASKLGSDNRVEGVSSTKGFASKVRDDDFTVLDGPPPGDLANAPATDTDPFFGPYQWDMRQIHTPQAHAITGGSRSVVVGDIDTGVDPTHPDLVQNLDDADSANCTSGAPVPGVQAANDDNGHGTHTAGTIAAASNGIGIVGVAPNVRLAAIKAGNADGLFFPEAVVCSFVWAGTHHLDVTNNSYFADPYEYNCRNDPTQRAIWKAEQRAIRFAMDQGVTVVAAAGNDADDLSHPTTDVTSPDYPPGTAEQRAITNACVVVPVEIPGVVGVSADGNQKQDTSTGQYPDYLKSYYSNFGVSAIDVVAPGGDDAFGVTPESAPAFGLVLSTYIGHHYAFAEGTSMASPHVAGIAALIISRYGDTSTPQNGKLTPGQVASLISRSADPQACPNTLPDGYESVTGTNSGAVQQCQGGPGFNSWYGNGQADALNAVTAASGNGG